MRESTFFQVDLSLPVVSEYRVTSQVLSLALICPSVIAGALLGADMSKCSLRNMTARSYVWGGNYQVLLFFGAETSPTRTFCQNQDLFTP